MNSNRVFDLERENLKLEQDNRVLKGRLEGDPHYRVCLRLGLTPKPARLLAILMSNEGPLSMRELMFRLYGNGSSGKEKVIETHMGTVRKRLNAHRVRICNRPGMGWWIYKRDRQMLLVRLGRGEENVEPDNSGTDHAGGLDRRRVRALAPSRG